jgi:hypothetical protein
MCLNVVYKYRCGHLVERPKPLECNWPKSTGRNAKYCPNWFVDKKAHVEYHHMNCGRCDTSFDRGEQLQEPYSFWIGLKSFCCCIAPEEVNDRAEEDQELVEPRGTEVQSESPPSAIINAQLQDTLEAAANVPLPPSPTKSASTTGFQGPLLRGPSKDNLTADAPTPRKEGPRAPVISMDPSTKSWVAPSDW